MYILKIVVPYRLSLLPPAEHIEDNTVDIFECI